jgi:hypothetical protein
MALPPLRWIAEEPLVYDQGANELLRPSCSRASGEGLAEGAAPELVWAPRVCLACGPDVTMSMVS